jgi:hypothetical protein
MNIIIYIVSFSILFLPPSCVFWQSQQHNKTHKRGNAKAQLFCRSFADAQKKCIVVLVVLEKEASHFFHQWLL